MDPAPLAALIIFGSALCSSSEAALFSAPLDKLHQLAKHDPAWSPALRVKKSITSSVSSIVVFNNVINIGGSMIVGNIIAQESSSLALGIFSAIFTLGIIVLGEIFPKILGEKWSLPYLKMVSPLILTLLFVLKPVNACIERSVHSFDKLCVSLKTIER